MRVIIKTGRKPLISDTADKAVNKLCWEIRAMLRNNILFILKKYINANNKFSTSLIIMGRDFFLTEF